MIEASAGDQYKETFNEVGVDGYLAVWFQLVCVLQGCVLSLLLFCIFLEIIIARTIESEDVGADVIYKIYNDKFMATSAKKCYKDTCFLRIVSICSSICLYCCVLYNYVVL